MPEPLLWLFFLVACWQIGSWAARLYDWLTEPAMPEHLRRVFDGEAKGNCESEGNWQMRRSLEGKGPPRP